MIYQPPGSHGELVVRTNSLIVRTISPIVRTTSSRRIIRLVVRLLVNSFVVYQRIAERLLSAERVPDFLSSFIGQLKNLTSDLAWVPRCARGGAVREKRMREMQSIEKAANSRGR